MFAQLLMSTVMLLISVNGAADDNVPSATVHRPPLATCATALDVATSEFKTQANESGRFESGVFVPRFQILYDNTVENIPLCRDPIDAIVLEAYSHAYLGFIERWSGKDDRGKADFIKSSYDFAVCEEHYGVVEPIGKGCVDGLVQLQVWHHEWYFMEDSLSS